MFKQTLRFSILITCAYLLTSIPSYADGNNTDSRSESNNDNQGSGSGNSNEKSESSGHCPGRSECTCESASEYQDRHCMDNTGMDIGR